MTNISADTLNAWIDGTLEPGERAAVDVAVSQDPALHQELLELQATARLLGELPELTPRKSFRLGDQFARPAPAEEAPSNPRGVLRLLPIVRSLSVAAALIFMVLAGSLFFDINGGSRSDPATTLQQQNVIMGETESHAGASEQAGDESNAADSTAGSGLTERGDAASVADEPMEDVSAMAPSAPEPESQSTAERAAPFGATAQSEDDRSAWIVASIILGAIVVVLFAAWFSMSSRVRKHQS